MPPRATTDPVTAGLFREGQEPQWVQPDGTLGPEASAQRFTFYTSPKEGEKVAMAMTCYRLAGGRKDWQELVASAERDRVAVRAQIEAELWPAGRPEAEDSAERAAQVASMADLWDDWDTEEKWRFDAAQQPITDYTFRAEWSTLIVDPAPAWKTLDDIAGTPVYFACWAAFNAATEASRAKKA